ncbi:hypothetical protein CAEBREN_07966 [Caenorhabditis brenneri]|uniref:Uncharacterized protein n=1 Tax=Caenorhabditis brenneri TaxID=135651 RepID=G0MGK8_CAEBE|nr:hypothetical protein CAEBREN_07966 [Caenorhabditis brenneri]
MKTEKGSYEYMIQENLFIFWLFSMLTLCAAFGIKTYHNIHEGRHNWKSRHQKLIDLKIGTIGFLACSIVHLVIGYMENGSCAGYIVLGLFGFVDYSRFLHYETVLLVQVHGGTHDVADENIPSSQWLYINVIACFLVDIHTLFVHSSEVYFLEDFLGERVVCKDALNGNEYRDSCVRRDLLNEFVSGLFVSVDGERYSCMHLKLEHVEKMIGGVFVKRCEDVTVEELSSLELADNEDVNEPKIENEKTA